MKIPNPQAILYAVSACILSAAMSAGGSWYLTQNYVTAKYEKDIATRALSVSEEITRLTEEKGAAELALAQARSEIDKGYADEIARQGRTIASLVADNIRLRDPGMRPGPSTCPGAPEGSSDAPGTDPGAGVLSEEASRFLLEFSGEADRVLEQLRACRFWEAEVQTNIRDWNAVLRAKP